jgi:hypothetical protein
MKKEQTSRSWKKGMSKQKDWTIVDLSGTRTEWRRLPTEIRKKLQEEGTRRVLQLWHDIRADAGGLIMPPIRMEPYAWIDKSGFVVHGQMRPVDPAGDGDFYFGVWLPAATVFLFDDAMLRRILVHEFNHCFWHSVTAFHGSPTGIGDESREQLSYNEQMQLLKSKDTEAHVNPSDWFGPRDAQEFLWYDAKEEGVRTLVPYGNMVRDKWLNRRLPVKEQIPLSFDLPRSGINLRQDMIDHIERLQQQKRSG